MTLRRALHLLIALLVTAGNIWVSLLERTQLPMNGPVGGEPTTGVILPNRDLEGHFVIWFLAGLLAISWWRSRRNRVWVWVGLIAISALVEVAQELMTTTRAGQLIDLVANTAGLIVAALLVELGYEIRRRSTEVSRRTTS